MPYSRAAELHNAMIAARSRTPTRSSARRRRTVLVVAVVAAIAGAVVAVLSVTADEEEPQALALPSEIVGPDPLAFDDRRRSAYERAAAFGLSHALFAKSPGGVTASAKRTAAYRPTPLSHARTRTHAREGRPGTHPLDSLIGVGAWCGAAPAVTRARYFPFARTRAHTRVRRYPISLEALIGVGPGRRSALRGAPNSR
jgi:hypothetical protein